MVRHIGRGHAGAAAQRLAGGRATLARPRYAAARAAKPVIMMFRRVQVRRSRVIMPSS
jgi:hypothetical protein